MPNQPVAGTVPLNVYVPENMKRMAEELALTYKYQPNAGPTTLREVVIVALDTYFRAQVPGYGKTAGSANLARPMPDARPAAPPSAPAPPAPRPESGAGRKRRHR